MNNKPGIGGGLEFLQKVFAGAFRARRMADTPPVSKRFGSHPHQPPNFQQHRPAGSKLARKAARSRSHMWG